MTTFSQDVYGSRGFELRYRPLGPRHGRHLREFRSPGNGLTEWRPQDAGEFDPSPASLRQWHPLGLPRERDHKQP
jgi:hypothetical protein